MASLSAILADTPTTGTHSPDIYSLLGTAVTPAIVVVLLLMGKLRTEAEVKRLEADIRNRDAVIATKDDQLSALQNGLIERAIPALTRSTLVLETLNQAPDLPVIRQPQGSGRRRPKDED